MSFNLKDAEHELDEVKRQDERLFQVKEIDIQKPKARGYMGLYGVIRGYIQCAIESPRK